MKPQSASALVCGVSDDVVPRLLQHEKTWTAAHNQTERAKVTDGLARLSEHLHQTD
jgi:hypothetical protein